MKKNFLHYLKSKEKGFTLMELLLVIAIIAILVGTILVSVSQQRDRAVQARVLAELSGAIQPILMCLSDDGTVNSPQGTSGGGEICSIDSVLIEEYGLWPSSPSSFENYQTAGSFDDNTWVFYLTDTDSSVTICCNARSSRCAEIPASTTCSNSIDLSNY